MNTSFIKRFYLIQLLAIPLLFGLLGFGSSAFAATEEEIEQAIDDGIAWLADDQVMLSDGSGYWYDPSRGGTTAITCFALIKLQDRAYELGFTPFDPAYAYSDEIIAGWRYVLTGGRTISWNFSGYPSEGAAGDYDGDDDGLGMYFQYDTYHWNYATGICLMALAATGTPDRENEAGTDFDGDGNADTYGEMAQDTVDYLAWAQEDSGWGRGGWYYNWDRYGADNSHTGYVTLGLAAAENFGIAVPPWVKTELGGFWIDYIQNDEGGLPSYWDGGSGYTNDTYWVNSLKTGNLLFEMIFVGDSRDTPRFQNALNYIIRHWRDPGNCWTNSTACQGWGYGANPAKYQDMFALMKGLEYSGTDTIDLSSLGGDPEHDWFQEFADVLLAQQLIGGNWPAHGWAADSTLSTIWSLLTLEKIAPQADPFTIEVTKDYRYTAVCFERDNDGDGLFNEDPVDFVQVGVDIEGNPIMAPVDNDGDGKFNEDPADCDPSSDTGYALPVTGEDPEAYTLEAVLKKNGKVTSYNTGQYYAVSKLDIRRNNPSIDKVMVTFDEHYAQCTCGDYPLSERSPKTGGGSVVVVEVVDGEARQIYDATSGVVEFYGGCCEEDGAMVNFEYTFEEGQETAELLVYVKFAPGLKGMTFDDEAANMCENFNSGLLQVFDDPEDDPIFETDIVIDDAWLKVVPK